LEYVQVRRELCHDDYYLIMDQRDIVLLAGPRYKKAVARWAHCDGAWILQRPWYAPIVDFLAHLCSIFLKIPA